MTWKNAESSSSYIFSQFPHYPDLKFYGSSTQLFSSPATYPFARSYAARVFEFSIFFPFHPFSKANRSCNASRVSLLPDFSSPSLVRDSERSFGFGDRKNTHTREERRRTGATKLSLLFLSRWVRSGNEGRKDASQWKVDRRVKDTGFVARSCWHTRTSYIPLLLSIPRRTTRFFLLPPRAWPLLRMYCFHRLALFLSLADKFAALQMASDRSLSDALKSQLPRLVNHVLFAESTGTLSGQKTAEPMDI